MPEVDSSSGYTYPDGKSQSMVNQKGLEGHEELKADAETGSQHPKIPARVMNESDLFGRNGEFASLLNAFTRRQSNSRELILITGKSGTGKTTLAMKLKTESIERGSYFISGKFDQLQRPEPFAPFVTAVELLVTQLSSEHIAKLRQIQFGQQDIDQHLLLHMIPTLSCVFGDSMSHSDSFTSLSNNLDYETDGRHHVLSDSLRCRFLVALSRFIQLLCRAKLSIVLFLDDLQWADLGSLELLYTLAESDQLKGLVVLGACRDNEVSAKDNLASMLRSLEKEKVRITEIKLSNFDENQVTEYVARQLQLSPEDCTFLGRMINRQTQGNILFVKRYVINMFDGGAFTHDGIRYRWDEELLEKVVATKTMTELIAMDLERIHPDRLYILQVASCLGAKFDEQLLRFVIQQDFLEPCLNHFEESSTLIREGRELRWYHDQIQQASYELIPKEERHSFRLKLGEKLQSNMTDAQLDKNLFVVASQFVQGVEDVEKPRERQNIAMLCLQCVRKAVSMASFETAVAYADAGVKVLGPNAFRENYSLALHLFNAAAEVAYCSGEKGKMRLLVEETLCKARTVQDKLQAYSTKIVDLGSSHRLDEAIDVGFSVLKQLGEPMPPQVGRLHAMFDIVRTNWMVRKLSANKILHLPSMTNQDKIAATKILDLLCVYLFFANSEYFPIVCCRMVRITIKYGLNVMSASAFSLYAVLLSRGGLSSKGEAYQYGNLGLQILEKYKSREWMPRVYGAYYGLVCCWREPIANTLEPLKKSYYMGQKTGDFELASLSGYLYLVNAELCGVPMSIQMKEALSMRDMMVAYRQETMLSFVNIQLQLLSNFLGQSEDPLVLTGNFMNQDEQLRSFQCKRNSTGEFAIHASRMILALSVGEYELVEVLGDNMEKMNSNRGELVSEVFNAFTRSCNALVLIRAGRQIRKNGRRWKLARRGLKLMRRFAKESPHNFLHRAHFLQAEIESLKGNFSDAITLYRLCRSLAEREGFLYEQAYCTEGMAIALKGDSREKEAVQSLKEARNLYDKWNAVIVCDRLDKMLHNWQN
jgi:predicted ATPase